MKAIIFDFDGVIHDTFDLAYGIHKQFQPESTKKNYRSYFDGNLFKKVDKKFDQAAHDKFRELEFLAFKELRLEREIREQLTLLAKKYDLYIISSNSIKNLSYYFENNNFTNVFKEILAAEAHKSKTEKFKMLFERYDLSSENCIFVTDTLGDILEANKVGVKSIAVDFGFHERERLEKGKPFEIISNFKDINTILNNID